MATEIVRSLEEIEAARERAQAAEMAAEDGGGYDEGASSVYQFLQWLFGYSDTDPIVEMGEDLDGDEDEQA